MSLESGFSGTRRVPPPVNDPVRSYAPGSPERAELKARLRAMAGERIDIPLVIGGKEVRTGDKAQAVMPHDHRHVLADWHKAAKRDLLNLLHDLAAQGKAVAFISSELPELLTVADRVLVMRRGQVVSEFDPRTAVERDIVGAAVGEKKYL